MTFPSAGPEALVGHAAEFALIREFLGRGASNGEVPWLAGGPGVGRTALVDTAAGAASPAGTQALRAPGAEFEADLPLRAAPGSPLALRSMHPARQDTL